VEYVARMGRTEMHTGFWWENLKERNYFENIKMNLTETGRKGMEWIHLALDRDKWQALVNMVKKLGFHQCGEYFDQLSKLLASQGLLHGLIQLTVIVQKLFMDL